MLGSFHGFCTVMDVILYYLYCNVVEAHSMLNDLKLLLHKHVGQFVRLVPWGSYILMQSLFSDTGL